MAVVNGVFEELRVTLQIVVRIKRKGVNASRQVIRIGPKLRVRNIDVASIRLGKRGTAITCK